VTRITYPSRASSSENSTLSSLSRSSVFRKTISTIAISALIYFFALNNASAQQTKYITDKLDVTLRSGKTTQHKVVRMLTSGTSVTILEADDKEGYTKVRTKRGAEGWVLSRYLLNQPVARERLAKAEQKIKELTTQGGTSLSRLTDLTDSQKTLKKENKKLTAENKKIQKDLNHIRQTAAKTLSIDRENQSLKKRLFALERDYKLLEQENDALKDRTETGSLQAQGY